MRAVALALLIGAALSACADLPREAASARDARTIIDSAVTASCPGLEVNRQRLMRDLGFVRTLGDPVTVSDGSRTRTERRYRLEGGDELAIRHTSLDERLQRIDLEVWRQVDGALRAETLAIALPDCTIAQGRRLAYDDSGVASHLAMLDNDLRTVGTPQELNPPVPHAEPARGVRVALVDSGVNYHLAFLRTALARGPDGSILGYDFWDGDHRPFDLDNARSPFFPERHGTSMASVILAEAPSIALVPYRYPRPALERMSEVVHLAQVAGVYIVALALGGDDPAPWQAFYEAAQERPDMLFIVSAGNQGRNIDRQPVWPARFELDNMLVVTASDARGRLARAANWGPETVDLMIPAENRPVVDHTGQLGSASGSSVAVARTVAAAARLAQAHPSWRAPELKRALIRSARKPTSANRPLVRHGWIEEPAQIGPAAPASPVLLGS